MKYKVALCEDNGMLVMKLVNIFGGVIFNSVLLYIMYDTESMRKFRSTYYVTSLSVSSLLLCLIVVTIDINDTLVDMISQENISTQVTVCGTETFFMMWAATAGSFSVLGIAIDRYQCICRPFHYVRRYSYRDWTNEIPQALLPVWGLSLLVAMIPVWHVIAKGHTAEMYESCPHSNHTYVTCFLDFRINETVRLIGFSVTFTMPALCVLMIYAVILWFCCFNRRMRRLSLQEEGRMTPGRSSSESPVHNRKTADNMFEACSVHVKFDDERETVVVGRDSSSTIVLSYVELSEIMKKYSKESGTVLSRQYTDGAILPRQLTDGSYLPHRLSSGSNSPDNSTQISGRDERLTGILKRHSMDDTSTKCPSDRRPSSSIVVPEHLRGISGIDVKRQQPVLFGEAFQCGQLKEDTITTWILTVVIITYFILWSPAFVMMMFHEDNFPDMTFEVAFLVANSNSWMNPLVYMFVNLAFRKRRQLEPPSLAQSQECLSPPTRDQPTTRDQPRPPPVRFQPIRDPQPAVSAHKSPFALTL